MCRQYVLHRYCHLCTILQFYILVYTLYIHVFSLCVTNYRLDLQHKSQYLILCAEMMNICCEKYTQYQNTLLSKYSVSGVTPCVTQYDQ
jgi:hypothetical protein